MLMAFKAVGILLIISVSTALGFMKAFKISECERTLFLICTSLCEMRERIRLNYGEIDEIISSSFPKRVLQRKNNKNVFAQSVCSDERKLLEEYFSSAGMGDIKSETERINTYITLFERRFSEMQKRSEGIRKLYKSLGFLGGVFISVFLI